MILQINKHDVNVHEAVVYDGPGVKSPELSYVSGYDPKQRLLHQYVSTLYVASVYLTTQKFSTSTPTVIYVFKENLLLTNPTWNQCKTNKSSRVDLEGEYGEVISAVSDKSVANSICTWFIDAPSPSVEIVKVFHLTFNQELNGSWAFV